MRRQFGITTNLALLVIGFGAGQGSLFIAQTWLVKSNGLALLGQFGTMFSFATLATYLVDMGALTTLARHINQLEIAGDTRRTVWPFYWAVTAVRFAMANALILIVFTAMIAVGDPFAQSYAIAASPSLLIWSFNVGGVLDGLRQSGVNGLAMIGPYLVSAVALPAVMYTDPATSGLTLGMAFSVGVCVSLFIQLTSLRSHGFVVCFIWPNRAAISLAAREAAGMLIQGLPAQVYFRVQIVFCGILLGSAVTGLFVYAKQITNAVGQLIWFLRRVEFPTLVDRLTSLSSGQVAKTFSVLRRGLIAAVAAAGGLASMALMAPAYLEGGDLVDAARVVAFLSPVILTSAISQTMMQGFLALGRFTTAAITSNIALLVGVALGFLLTSLLGIAGLIAAEAIMHLVSVGIMLYVYRRIENKHGHGF